MNKKFIRLAGFTLIEIITTIVILAVAATAIMSVFTNTVRSSANPVIQQQAVSIAEAYMEEILLKSFDDPDGIDGETNRNVFDDVNDYHNLSDNGARDQNSVTTPTPTPPISGLENYTVTVAVSAASLNSTVPALLVVVTVDHDVLDPVVLRGYRTDY